MNRPTKKNTKNLEELKSFTLSKKDQTEVKGGLLFRMLDEVRCSVDRTSSWLFGSRNGNGDGDW